MASLVTQVIDSLTADSAVSDDTTGTDGRVYDRELKRNGNYATPEAYDVASGRLKLSIVVQDENTTEYPNRDDVGIHYIVIWLHHAESAVNREEVRQLAGEVTRVLKTTNYTGDDGSGMEVRYLDGFGVRADPDNADAILAYNRYAFIKMVPTY